MKLKYLLALKCITKSRASQNLTNKNARWSSISASDWPRWPVFELVRELIDIRLQTKPRQNPLINKGARASRNLNNQNARWSYISASVGSKSDYDFAC